MISPSLLSFIVNVKIKLNCSVVDFRSTNMCIYTLSIRLRKIRLPLMVKIKKDRREREKERSLAFSWKYLDITMFSLHLMTKDEPGFGLRGGCCECCWSHLTVFSTPTIVSPRLKRKSLVNIVIAGLRKVTCRRECRAHYSVMAAQPVKVREIYISWKDGIKRFQLNSN